MWRNVITVLSGKVLEDCDRVNYVVCSRHFAATDYKENCKKRLLRKEAYPSLLVPPLPKQSRKRRSLEDELVEVARAADARDCTENSAGTSSAATPAPTSGPGPRQRRQRRPRSARQKRVVSVSQKLSRRDATVRRLRLRAQQREKPPRATVVEKRFQQVVAAAADGDTKALFILEQVKNFPLKKPRWTEPVVRECVLLACISPTAYDQARAGILLQGMPVRSTLKRYLGPSTGEVGITSDVRDRMEAEVKTLQPIERFCTLMVDEMAIAEKAVLDKKSDQVFGVENLDEQDENNNRHLANKLLCFVIHGCCTPFTIPASYYFTRSASGTDLHRLALQKKELIKPVRYLSRKHVTPLGIEKQNVERADQFFSPSLVATLGIHNERLEWMEGEFLDYMRAIKAQYTERKMEFLTNETWEALQFTSKSTPAFIRYLLEQGFFYVLSRCLNSDPVESTFGAVRRLCGSNDMVDARSAMYALEKILRVGGLKTSRYSNVGEADAVPYKGNLKCASRARPSTSYSAALLSVDAEAQALARPLRSVSLDRALYPSLRNAALALPVSFVLRAVEERIECDVCVPGLRALDSDRSPLMALIRQTDRGSLAYPSMALMNVAGVIRDFTSLALKKMDSGRRGITAALSSTLQPHLLACPLLSGWTCCHRERVADILCEKLLPVLVTNACLLMTDNTRPAVALRKKPVNRKYMRGLTRSAPGFTLERVMAEDEEVDDRDQLEDF
ncbi:DNA transposase [Frankliniella fusca]|uniref:DNA transposase n=1 Tax=Frankliniella fusca TaxID=407009 RepID=A0AAE1GUX3_9NEOP|nr:DNA transposase [Frankliniella fusca]